MLKNPNQHQTKSQKSAIKRAAFSSLPIALSITIAAPLGIMSSNPDDLQITNGSSFISNLVYSTAFFFCLFFAIALIAGLIGRQTTRLVNALFAPIILWILYLPLSIGTLDGFDQIEVNILNVFFGALLTLFAWFFHKHITFLFYVLAAGPLVTGLVFFVGVLKFDEPKVPITASTNAKNVFVISFDALQTAQILPLIESSEATKKMFDGFIYFRNPVAAGPFTVVSTIHTKLGYVPETTADLNRAMSDDFFTSRLSKQGFDVETYNKANTWEGAKVNKLQSNNIVKLSDDETYFRALGSAAYRIFPVQLDLIAIDNLFLYAHAKLLRNDLRASIYKDPVSVVYLKREIESFDAFVENLRSMEGPGTVRFHHYSFTHDPMRFSEKCAYKNIIDWRYEDVVDEAACSISKFNSFIQKLKEIEVYENSMVFLISDHGHECAYQKKFNPDAYKVSNRHCIGRYRPVMMAKDFNSDKPLIFEDFPVTLTDIAKTICVKTLQDTKEGCEKYTGIDLFNEAARDRMAPRQILVEKDDGSTHWKKYKTVNIGRTISIGEYFGQSKNSIYYVGSRMRSRVGHDNFENFSKTATSGEDKKGWLIYGPSLDIEEGRYAIEIDYIFTPTAGNVGSTKTFVDIVSNRGSVEYSKTLLRPTSGAREIQTLVVDIPTATNGLETRVGYHEDGDVEVFKISITKQGQ